MATEATAALMLDECVGFADFERFSSRRRECHWRAELGRAQRALSGDFADKSPGALHVRIAADRRDPAICISPTRSPT
jgi:hypothetical protein